MTKDNLHIYCSDISFYLILKARRTRGHLVIGRLATYRNLINNLSVVIKLTLVETVL